MYEKMLMSWIDPERTLTRVISSYFTAGICQQRAIICFPMVYRMVCPIISRTIETNECRIGDKSISFQYQGATTVSHEIHELSNQSFHMDVLCH